MTKTKGKIKNRKKIKLSEAHKENIRKSMKGKQGGKENPAWKGGKSRKYSQNIKKTLPQVCVICGSNENLEIHHKDRNPENNELSNLAIFCRYHHKIEHIDHLIPFQYKKKEKIVEFLK